MLTNYGLQELVAPPVEPLAATDIQYHGRLPQPLQDSVNDTALLNSYIKTARRYFEKITDRSLITTTWLLATDAFPGRHIDEYRPPGWRYGIIRMPRAPLVSVSSIQYIDPGTGLLTALDPSMYQLSTITEPGKIAPARFQIWPITDPLSFNAVQITYVAGHGATAASVPEEYKHCVRLLATHLWENREVAIEVALQQIPYALKDFLLSCKVGDQY